MCCTSVRESVPTVWDIYTPLFMGSGTGLICVLCLATALPMELIERILETRYEAVNAH